MSGKQLGVDWLEATAVGLGAPQALRLALLCRLLIAVGEDARACRSGDRVAEFEVALNRRALPQVLKCIKSTPLWKIAQRLGITSIGDHFKDREVTEIVRDDPGECANKVLSFAFAGLWVLRTANGDGTMAWLEPVKLQNLCGCLETCDTTLSKEQTQWCRDNNIDAKGVREWVKVKPLVTFLRDNDQLPTGPPSDITPGKVHSLFAGESSCYLKTCFNMQKTCNPP